MNDMKPAEELAMAIYKLRDAFAPGDKCAGTDATETSVESVTEALMGVTAGLVALANSVSNGFSELAQAIHEHKEDA